MSELLSYSLDRLRKEPELLQEEKLQIERSIQSSAVGQYGAFLAAASALSTIDNELESVCSALDGLLTCGPQLAAACEQFASESAGVMDSHAANKALVAQQSTLVELLEVPQLMDTCVRNGIYDEALDLQAFIMRLGLLHTNVPLVRLLMEQVSAVGTTLLSQLLARLRTNLQLPECLRIIGYLRRIAAFSEADLRLQFLACRDEWFSGLVAELDEGDAYEYLKQLIDLHRLHLFDIIMQYRAIFFDAAPTNLEGAAAPAAASSVSESAVLYSWVQQRLQLFMAALDRHLPASSEGGNLASITEHATYCGASLSRVGLDLTGLLQRPLEERTLALFVSHLSSAVEAFSSRLEAHKWVLMPAPMLAKAQQQAAQQAATAQARISQGGASEGTGGEGDDGLGSTPPTPSGSTKKGSAGGTAVEEDLSPPYMVMEHLPLAVFVNGVLAAFNELRLCAMMGLTRRLAEALQQSLEAVAANLVQYRSSHALTEAELPLFRSAARALVDVVFPYLAAGFGRIMPGGGAKLDPSTTATLVRQCLDDL